MFEEDKPTTILNLITPKELGPAPMPAEPPPQKDPGLAFLLSLLVPGLGQFYCGEKRRASWTLLFSLVSAALVVWLWTDAASGGEGPASMFWGVAFRSFLVLYAFSFLDAYFTAQEIRTGDAQYMAYNPRVAAVLNLTTRGFGYWYLDQGKKGVLLFIVLGAANRVSMQTKNEAFGFWVGVIVEIALVALAADAYRIAQAENQVHLARKPQGYGALVGSPSMNAGIPVALAGLLGAGYVGLVTLGFVMPDYNSIDQAQAKISSHELGKSYVNPKYGVELHVPPGWSLDNSDKENIVDGEAEGSGCSVSLIAGGSLPFRSLEAEGRALVEQIRKQGNEITVVRNLPGQLAGHASREIGIELSPVLEGIRFIKLHQDYFLVKRGLTIFALIETNTSEESCRKDLAKIHERLVLPK